MPNSTRLRFKFLSFVPFSRLYGSLWGCPSPSVPKPSPMEVPHTLTCPLPLAALPPQAEDVNLFGLTHLVKLPENKIEIYCTLSQVPSSLPFHSRYLPPPIARIFETDNTMPVHPPLGSSFLLLLKPSDGNSPLSLFSPARGHPKPNLPSGTFFPFYPFLSSHTSTPLSLLYFLPFAAVRPPPKRQSKATFFSQDPPVLDSPQGNCRTWHLLPPSNPPAEDDGCSP